MIVLKLAGARARARARDGKCEGRKAYGHYEGEGKTLEVIRSLAENGESASEIARALNASGCRTRSGGAWHPFTVGRIVKRVS